MCYNYIKVLSTLMVTAEDVDDTGMASIHLEWASITTKTVFPSTSPMWSM